MSFICGKRIASDLLKKCMHSLRHCQFTTSASRAASLTLVQDKATGTGFGYSRHIILNDVKRRNALSMAMIQELQMHMNDAHKESLHGDLGVLIFQANGPVFSSGHDLKEIQALRQESPSKVKELFHSFSQLMLSLENLPCPVIASVRGLATAAGCQLVATCDLVVASEKAQFALPGIKVGLFCSTPAVAVARSLSRKLAMQMLFTGEPISATRACQHGLVSELVADEEVEAATATLASKILHYSRPVQRLGKSVFQKQMSCDTKELAYTIAEEGMTDNVGMPDCKEGLSSFAEKRTPKWTNQS